MNMFEKWNKDFGGDITAEKIKESNGTGNYEEVPHGNYEVKIEKMELTSSKAGKPMVTIWFNIIAGKYKNSKIFMNQVITQAFQVHIVMELIRSLGCDIDWNEDYGQFAEDIADVFEEVADLEMNLNYGQNKKGFNTFKIEEVFE